MMERLTKALDDINFFSGASKLEVMEGMDDDMEFEEIIYTLEELRFLIVTRLIEEGRTYEA